MFNKKENFSLAKRIRSFKYALQGIVCLCKTEHNAKIHLVATLGVVVAGLVLKIALNEWIAIIFAIGFVWVAESFNTAIEYLCDKVSPEYDELIRRAKDVAAAGVLIAAATAVAVGLIVFVPKITTSATVCPRTTQDPVHR